MKATAHKIAWRLRHFGAETSQLATHAFLGVVRLVWHRRPAPLGLMLGARRIFRQDDSLCQPCESVVTSGRVLRDAHLAIAFANKEFGAWALAAETVNFLEAYIRRAKPRCVLELGSGLSTACLAHVLCETIDDGDRRVIAIEESAVFLSETRSIVDALALSEVVELHLRPLCTQTVDERTVSTYDLGDLFIESITTPPPPDLVVIDGPSTGGMGRFAALYLLQPHLRTGTTVMLDDALRDVELATAERWRNAGILAIDGIHVIGKGLLVGRITHRERVDGLVPDKGGARSVA